MQNSIFDLIRSEDELPSTNENMANLFYREVQPLRNIQDTLSSISVGGVSQLQTNSVFGNGLISLRWTLDNRTWWIPSKSYFKFRIIITDKYGDVLNSFQKIAPNMGICSNLIQKMQYKMNDTTVDSIDENLAECDSIMERAMKSQEWLSKTVGDDVNYWNAYHKERLQQISSNGKLGQECSSENMEITDKAGLGYGIVAPTTSQLSGVSVRLTAAGVLTFRSNNSGVILPRIEDVWKVGDVINCKFSGNLYWRTFWIIRVVTTKSYAAAGEEIIEQLIVSGDGIAPTAGGDPNAGVNDAANQGSVDIKRWRFGCASLLDRTGLAFDHDNAGILITAGNAQSATPSNHGGMLQGWDTADDKLGVNIKIGSPVIVKVSANGALDDTLYAFVRTEGNVNEDEAKGEEGLQLTSYNQNAAIGAANNGIGYLEYEGIEIASDIDLGYENGAFRVSLLRPGIGVNTTNTDLLTITLQAGANNNLPPDINRLFKEGDLLIIEKTYGNNNVAERTNPRYCWVQTVDPINNGRFMEVSGGTTLAADYLAQTDDYVIKFRVRYCGKPINNIAKRKSTFEACWKPSCLGIFNYPGALPGGTKSEIELTPFTNKFYQLRGVETPYGIQKFHVSSGTNGDYRFLVDDVKLYIAQVNGPLTGQEDDSYYISLDAIKCHKQTLTTGNQTQTNIDVMPSSYAFSLAFQDSRAGSQTDISSSKFHVGDKEELKLKRYSIRFGGLSLPQPDADLNYSNTQNYLMGGYMRTMLYNQRYFSLGSESFHEWLERGMYFYHPFLRSANNKETRAYVITDFGSAFTNPNNVRILFFEYFQKVALIKMNNGNVYQVSVANS